MDVSTSLAVLIRNIGAWPNSGVRDQMPAFLQAALDEQARDDLCDSLRMIHKLSQDYGYDVAIEAMMEGLRINRSHFCDAAALAVRIHGYGLLTDPEEGPDLKIYDSFIGGTAR